MLRREVVRLKREMNATSSQDQFAKWAKLRRQHDKALAEYDQKSEAVLVMPLLLVPEDNLLTEHGYLQHNPFKPSKPPSIAPSP